jgi:hypothetical protein
MDRIFFVLTKFELQVPKIIKSSFWKNVICLIDTFLGPYAWKYLKFKTICSRGMIKYVYVKCFFIVLIANEVWKWWDLSRARDLPWEGCEK